MSPFLFPANYPRVLSVSHCSRNVEHVLSLIPQYYLHIILPVWGLTLPQRNSPSSQAGPRRLSDPLCACSLLASGTDVMFGFWRIPKPTVERGGPGSILRLFHDSLLMGIILQDHTLGILARHLPRGGSSRWDPSQVLFYVPRSLSLALLFGAGKLMNGVFEESTCKRKCPLPILGVFCSSHLFLFLA